MLKAHTLNLNSGLFESETAVPFVKGGQEQNYDIYIYINYSAGGASPVLKHTMIDTGNHVLTMDSFDDLKAANPDIQVLQYNVREPWNHAANLVKGTVTLNLAGGGVLTLADTTFYACTESDCVNNLGLANAEGSQSPLMNRPNLGYVEFDYQRMLMLLHPNYECSTQWMGVDMRPGMIWPFVFIDELAIGGVQTQWAHGKGGPPQYSGNRGSMGMFDTGGGPMFLAYGNIAGLPGIPPPKAGACPSNLFFGNVPECNVAPAHALYCSCACYYGNVSVTLEAADSSYTQIVRFAHADVARISPSLPPSQVPTFVGCNKASLGGGDYANLGGALFDLNRITFDVNGHRVCVENY